MADANVTRTLATETREPNRLSGFFKKLFRHHPLGAFGLVITVVFLLTAVFAETIAPYDMNAADINRRLQGPSREFLLGTDLIGRDMFSRIVIGTRTSLTIGLAASAGSVVIALILGILSGYLGGIVDMAVQRFVDAWMAIPGLTILMVIVSIIGTSVWAMIFILSLGGVVGSRLIRSTVIRIREDMYLAAATAIGSRTLRILLRHVMPNILPPIIVAFTGSVPGMILSEAGLSFLGFGLGPPTPSWGAMLSGQVRFHMFEAPHLVIWPGVALALVVYGTNMFGDALRDILDPRLRGGAGRFGGTAARRKLEKTDEKPGNGA